MLRVFFFLFLRCSRQRKKTYIRTALALLNLLFPKEVKGILVEYFQFKKRGWEHKACAGEYESCVECFAEVMLH
jgi:hypothetical protein